MSLSVLDAVSHYSFSFLIVMQCPLIGILIIFLLYLLMLNKFSYALNDHFLQYVLKYLTHFALLF